MVNHMPEVAKMLGVEIGEKFTFEYSDGEMMGTAVIEESGFKLLEYNANYTNSWFQHTLENLLTGKYTIKCKPWKPNLDDEYYYVDECGYVCSDPWIDSSVDFVFYKIGNCYKTKEEADKNKDKWVAFYASDEVLEV